MSLAVGVDIGGTKVAAGLVDEHGRVLARTRRATPGRDVRAVEDTVVEVVGELVRGAAQVPGQGPGQGPGEVRPVVAVGVGAAGFVDGDRSTVLFSPHLAWRDEPLGAALSARLGRPVLVDNDANGAGWGESRFGAGRDEPRLVCLTLGTGIGGAIVLDGRLERGRNGLAGEFGHMVLVPGGQRCECGGRGCWEQYASGNALGREGGELARSGSPVAHELLRRAGQDPGALTGADVTAAALDGDPASRELIAEMGRWFGIGLANLAAALDPGAFVVGGGLGAAGELLLGPAREALAGSLTGRGHRPLPRVAAAALGAEAGLVGMADLARLAVAG